jgi:tripartite-type tricarboxylate transporter receptor subunit TctC
MNHQPITLTAAVLLWVAAFAGQAQDAVAYPTKPIRLIVPTVPGPPPDVMARNLGEKLAGALGQPVIVDNRPGAIGTIGLNIVVKAPADGYTIGVIGLAYIAGPSLLAHVPYDTEKQLVPVTLTNWSYPVLAVPAASPVRSVGDLVALAKSRPGMLKYSSGGNATPPHLAGELFKREAGVEILHIPYKGSTANITALVAGEVDLAFGPTMALSPHIKSGKLRALATAGRHRLAPYPEVPTLVELGYSRLEVNDWHGIVAPSGTPGEVIGRLHAEIMKVLANTDFRQRLDALGMETVGLGPEPFAAHIRSEIQRWNRLVRDAGIKAD